MKVFFHGIYASGKTYCAKEYAIKKQITFINFDVTWDYKDKNCSLQTEKYLSQLPENFSIDAIPYDDEQKGIGKFLEWAFDKSDVYIIVVFCSDEIEWFRRLREIKRKIDVDQFYIDRFYFVLMYRIMCLKNYRNTVFYDTFKLEYVVFDEMLERLDWVFKKVSKEFKANILDRKQLYEILQQQKYDWDYQDVEVLKFESQFKTYKSWDNIKKLVDWRNKKVVDIGTNHAYMAIKADKKGANVIALDKDENRLNMAKKIIFVSRSSVQCKLWHSGEPVPKCDIILCLNVLHHIQNKEEFFNTLDCKQIIFEIKLKDIEIVEKYFDVIQLIKSHRRGRRILLCQKK